MYYDLQGEEVGGDGGGVEMGGVDENYDPSAAFLGAIMERRDDSTINHDLEVSDSDDDQGGLHTGDALHNHNQQQQQHQQPDAEEEDEGSLWF